ncbi:protein far1-related sequence 3 [Phtheirospermum japonicum]|uniref:Protein far1-related sequence 3 n=1 Tax=Phtheirospermum japonicum TaxID=374723 RepID=A0A830BCH8_9LAMI|nr:protein far1-related sequence 3 [Phtheirospermum japonicum]
MMMFGETTLSEHLLKLDGVKSKQELENLLRLLWRTRKTGLSDPQKSSLQSLLNIPSPSQLDPNRLEPFVPFYSSDISGSSLSMRIDPDPLVNGHNHGAPTPITAEKNVMSFPQLNLQNDVVPTEILGVYPRVKSMTWSVENKSVVPANRVAIITLKLQDYTKSPLDETEVKFQLTRDTLEAVLRSMSYIKEQLSRSVRSSSLPFRKKQRQ